MSDRLSRRGFFRRTSPVAAATLAVGGSAAAQPAGAPQPMINVRDFGARGDDRTDDTRALQAAVDFAAGLWRGESIGGGGAEVFVPAGRYRFRGLRWRPGVNLRGEGKDHTLLLLMGDGSTGIGAEAGASLFWGSFRGLFLLSGEAAPRRQVLWNAAGFSRWTLSEVSFGWSDGCIAVAANDAAPASEGGPTSWYNDFYSCFFEKNGGRPGGVALLLGGVRAGQEQVTTWQFFGGRISGPGGVGAHLQSAAGLKFFGVTFEALDVGVAVGAPGAARPTQVTEFHGCYWEGCRVTWRIEASARQTMFFGGLVTGGAFEDRGVQTTYNMPGLQRTHLGPDASDFWEIAGADGGLRQPTIRGDMPGLTLQNGQGRKATWVNNAAGSSRDSYHEFRDHDGRALLQAGQGSAGVAAAELRLGGGSAAILTGAGSPEAVVAAPAGSLYLRTDAQQPGLYVKERGRGKTGWTHK